ncbi:hypothetical protein D7X88_00620 [bacterium C-53]|nr:hypothetical protein [Lachnospiraceae bacterium]NBI01523.1 hypothetical protein [Lachnospiraceae bacterium]RKJ12828.1 hypothetical protein D7X88_00620 [bacterium C-53]
MERYGYFMTLKERFRKENLLYNLLSLPVLLYTVYLLAMIINASFGGASYPNEYREAANVQLTQWFMNGKNPYSTANLSGEVPGMIYLYGPFYSVVTALLGFFIRTDIVVLHHIVTFLAVLLTGIMMAKIVWEHSLTITAPLTAFLFGILCHWRWGSYVSAAPDSFGLMLLVLGLFILTREKLRGQPYAAAFVTVAAFFTKQYFVMIFATSFAFFFFLKKKDVVKYLIAVAGMFAFMAVVLTLTCPMFWSYTIYLMKGTGSGVSKGKSGTSYSQSQTMYIGGMFFFLFLAAAVDFFRTAVWKRGIRIGLQWKDGDKPLFPVKVSNPEEYGRRDILVDILLWGHMAVAGICLLYIGRNNGAWISYYLQLFMPALMMEALMAVDNFQTERRFRFATWFRSASFVLYCCLIFVTISKTSTRLVVDVLSAEEEAAWEEAYEILDDALPEGDTYYMPVLCFHAFVNDRYAYNTGQPFVVSEHFYDEWKGSETYQKLFPYAGDIFAQNLAFRETIIEKVRNGGYALVTNIKETDVVFTEEDLSVRYEKSRTLSLRTGRQTWEVDFWTLKQKGM